ncbi:hypothetical protein EZV62_009259 [Acer yangbiense]|uniref:Uncharacterized protein n=1 Tax=Acer yangbiense TaxID=1000413 RepID=A0A5C7IG66_9ROSI|nr:hypothetical protein EZV62_009259 [Acer yangbiense]
MSFWGFSNWEWEWRGRVGLVDFKDRFFWLRLAAGKMLKLLDVSIVWSHVTYLKVKIVSGLHGIDYFECFQFHCKGIYKVPVIGMAFALNMLFQIPFWIVVLLAGFNTLVLLAFQQYEVSKHLSYMLYN